MRVHAGVSLTLIRAKPARGSASVKHAADHLVVKPGPAGRKPAGDVANVGAIEIEPDALCERVDRILGKAGVRAGGTGLGTGVTFLNATDQQVAGLALHFRMRPDHLLNLHQRSPHLDQGAHHLMISAWKSSSSRGSPIPQRSRLSHVDLRTEAFAS
jgi:hypothetical protein